jgi:hypothetical protein
MHTKSRENIIYMALLTAMFLYMFFKVRLGLHYDEAYLVDLGKVKMDGIKSVSECWDILQLAGLILYPFMKVFHSIVGSYEGVILYFRYLYLIIHLAIAVYAYFTIKILWSNRQAIAISLLSFMFSFYWYTICYRSILYWGSFLAILFIIRYIATQKIHYVCLSAISFCVSVICFPTLVLMVIPLTVFFAKCGINKKSEISAFWLTCIACAAVLVLGRVAESGLGALLSTIKYTFTYESADSSHKLVTCAELIILLIVGEIAYRIFSKIKGKLGFLNSYFLIVAIIEIGFLAVIIAARPSTAGIARFWYAFVLFFVLLLPVFRAHSEIKHHMEIKLLFVYPSICLMFVIALSTANGLAIAAYGGVLGIMGFILLLSDDALTIKSHAKVLEYLLLGLFCFCMIFFVPDNELGASNIFWSRVDITDGPARGVYVTEATKEKYDEICYITKENVTENDKLFILADGFRAYGFMCTGAKQVSHWPYVVYPDSERAVEYFESIEACRPTVAIVSKKFVEDFYAGYERWLSETPLGNHLQSKYELVNESEEWTIWRQR